MKVHRIITTIEVEDNNSTTSVELTKVFLDNIHSPIVVTDIKSMVIRLILLKCIML